MKDTLLTRRYAKAFLDFAIRNNMTEEGLSDLETVCDTINESHELRGLLSGPFVSDKKKSDILVRIFKDNVSAKTLNFISMMIEKNRSEIIGDIYEQYRDLYNEYNNIEVVTITTAVEIDEATRQKFLTFVKDIIKGHIQIVNKIDEKIIGGFIIRRGDYEYDASIRTKLKRLSKIFTENLYVKGY